MDIIEENENYTDLKLEGILSFIGFKMRLNRIQYHCFKDNETTTPYSIIIKGAKYRFEPNEGTN